MAALEQEIAAHRHTLDLLRRTELAYGRFVPRQLLRLLGVESILDLGLGDQTERQMTILFSDIREFTRLSETMTPGETFAFMNSYLGEIEPVIGRHHGIVDKYIGDAVMAIFPGTPDDGLRCAIAMRMQLRLYNEGRARAGYAPVDIGIGLNTGIVMLGTVGGVHRMEGTVLSDAVNVASRLESSTKEYGTPLLISESTWSALADASKYRIRFLDRFRAKGKSRAQSVYEVFDADPEPLREGKAATRMAFEKAVAYYHLKAIDQAVPLLVDCVARVPGDRSALLYLERCREFRLSGRHYGTGELSGKLEWNDEYLVGVAQIDSEHKELVSSMNRLAEGIRKTGFGDVSEAMKFLDDYARFHFANEEAMMREVAYPFIEEHLREHRKFAARLEGLKKDIGEKAHDSLYLGFQIELFLFDWLADHMTKTDRHLGRFIRARSQ